MENHALRIGERRGLGVPVRSQRGGQVIALGDIEIDAFSQLVSVIGETRASNVVITEAAVRL